MRTATTKLMECMSMATDSDLALVVEYLESDTAVQEFESVVAMEAGSRGFQREVVDYTMFDSSYTDTHSSTQEMEVAACRYFYTNEEPLPVVDTDEVFFSEIRSELPINDKNIGQVTEWLRNWKTWAAFRPAVVEQNGKLVLVY